MKPATLVLSSGNAKLGKVGATYASIESTCPTSCAFRGEGCYAQTGHVAFTVRRLDADGASPENAALYEASLLDNATKVEGLPLRMHVSGDARTPLAAEVLGRAAGRWQDRGGGPVWTYTHAWRDVPRSAWTQGISVLASVEGTAQAAEARGMGYVPAVVVETHPADGKAWTDGEGHTWIPCPEQTRGITCDQCRLCWNEGSLAARNVGIAFAVHGAQTKRALRCCDDTK
jgi:hypothetical protein